MDDKKTGLELAVGIVNLYDPAEFTSKQLQEEIISHLKREIKEL